VSNFSTVQRELFQQLDEPTIPAAVGQPVDLDIHLELLGAISSAIRDAKRRGLSRERIVDRMNEVLPDSGITVRQLNAWTAQSKEWREFPARYLVAFCFAAECDLPLRIMANALGFDLADRREQVAKELGESLIASARLKRQQSELRQRLGG
jgi:hypothetical protein